MAVTLRFMMQGAESGDILTESLATVSGVTIQTTRLRSGKSYGYGLDYSVTGAHYLLDSAYGGLGDEIIFLSGWAGLSAAPSSEATLMFELPGGSGTAYKHVTVGTDQKLRIYDKNGTRVGPDGLGITLPTTGGQEFHIIFDGITLPTVYIKVYSDTGEVNAFDTGLTKSQFWGWTAGNTFQLGWGEYNVPSSRAFTLYPVDLVMQEGVAAGDAPHLTAYPRYLSVGQDSQRMTSEGNYNSWGNDYTYVNEAGANDGDTTSRGSTGANAKQTMKSSSANPVPASPTPTIDWVQLRDVGKIGFTNKLGGHFMVRLGGVDSIDSQGNSATRTTSYSGGGWGSSTGENAKVYGFAWVRGNFDPNTLEVGWQTEGTSGFQYSPIVTKQPNVQIIYHTAVLPAGTTPPPPATGAALTRRLRQLVGVGI